MSAAGVAVGVGLPHNLPGADGPVLLEWATRAERLGFHSLVTTDRLVYRGHESLVTLAAAAAVTTRIRLLTGVLIGPVHSNTALLAKQTASIDALSGGRLRLGLAVGARPDDYAASGLSPAGRGAALDRQIDELRRIWAGERRGIAGPIGPAPVAAGGPPILLGGQSAPAFRRVLTKGTGWISGGAGPKAFAGGLAAIRGMHAQAGREFTGPTAALAYVALGPDAEADADRFVTDYYGFAPPLAAMIRAGVLTTPRAVRGALAAYEELGCDEVILVPCGADVRLLDVAAEAVLPVPAFA